MIRATRAVGQSHLRRPPEALVILALAQRVGEASRRLNREENGEFRPLPYAHRQFFVDVSVSVGRHDFETVWSSHFSVSGKPRMRTLKRELQTSFREPLPAP